jgi:hypothetical protein
MDSLTVDVVAKLAEQLTEDERKELIRRLETMQTVRSTRQTGCASSMLTRLIQP